MGDPPSGTPHQSDFERGRTTARSMSDRELLDLHAQGAAAFQAGAWDVLDAEVRRRQRVRDRQTAEPHVEEERYPALRDRKSTRLNSSHGYISYAVFCLKKKKIN